MEGIVRGIIKLNPLTEIIFLISVSIISFANNSLKLDVFILLMVAIIALFMGLVKISLKALSMFVLLQGLKYFVLPILPDVISAHFGLLVIHAPKLIPIFLVGQILVKTNPIRNIMYALKMMHFPKPNYFSSNRHQIFSIFKRRKNINLRCNKNKRRDWI